MLIFLKANEVVDEVNSWAEKANKGLITALLPCGSFTMTPHLFLQIQSTLKDHGIKSLMPQRLELETLTFSVDKLFRFPC